MILRRRDLWLRDLKLWLPALAFFLLNLGALAYYRLEYAGESAGLERRVGESERELAQLVAERQEREHLLERAAVNQRLIEEIYRERFATRRQRLTQIIDEVKSLARQAGLVPQAISYPEESLEELALVQRSFEFSVEGNYQQLRTFINFLELSPSFLMLEKVELSGGEGSGLRISLTLSTLFTVSDEAVAQVVETSS